MIVKEIDKGQATSWKRKEFLKNSVLVGFQSTLQRHTPIKT
jgi:hypothetical protein